MVLVGTTEVREFVDYWILFYTPIPTDVEVGHIQRSNPGCTVTGIGVPSRIGIPNEIEIIRLKASPRGAKYSIMRKTMNADVV
jgi:hypothetical protein